MARGTFVILYYSIVLSSVIVLMVICMGVIQFLSLIAHFSTREFWDGVDAVGDQFDIIGSGIYGAIVGIRLLSLAFYIPW